MNSDRLAKTLALIGLLGILAYGAWTIWQINRSSPIPTLRSTSGSPEQ